MQQNHWQIIRDFMREQGDKNAAKDSDFSALTAAKSSAETVKISKCVPEEASIRPNTPQDKPKDKNNDWTSQPLCKAAVKMSDDYLARRNVQMPTPTTSPAIPRARRSVRTSQEEVSQIEEKSNNSSPIGAKLRSPFQSPKNIARARSRSTSFDPLSYRYRQARRARKDGATTPCNGARSPKSPKTPKPPTPPQCPGAPRGPRNRSYFAKLEGWEPIPRRVRGFPFYQKKASYYDPEPPIHYDFGRKKPKLEDYTLLVKLVEKERQAIRQDFESHRGREDRS